MRADFSGEWKMDLATSEALGPVLRELGLNRVLASVVAKLGVSQTISQDRDKLTIQVKTRVSKETLTLPFDGSSVLSTAVSGGKTATVTRWLDDQRLETRQSLTADDAALPPDDAAADCFVTVRYLRGDDGALVEANSVVRGGVAVEKASALRVLRRV